MTMRKAMYYITTVVGELLMTVGVFMLLFVGWQLVWTDVVAEQDYAESRTELVEKWDTDELDDIYKNVEPLEPAANDMGLELVDDTEGAEPALDETNGVQANEPAVKVKTRREPPKKAVKKNAVRNEPFALIHIPRFGSSYKPKPIYEGIDYNTLKKGMGHYADSAMPGDLGNFAVAGHRVTYGRPLHKIANLRANDPIVVETDDSYFVYRVQTKKIVKPSHTSVLASVPGKPGVGPTERVITLTACHPKYSARQRYIVHGKLDYWQPKSAGKPTELK